MARGETDPPLLAGTVAVSSNGPPLFYSSWQTSSYLSISSVMGHFSQAWAESRHCPTVAAGARCLLREWHPGPVVIWPPAAFLASSSVPLSPRALAPVSSHFLSSKILVSRVSPFPLSLCRISKLEHTSPSSCSRLGGLCL